MDLFLAFLFFSLLLLLHDFIPRVVDQFLQFVFLRILLQERFALCHHLLELPCPQHPPQDCYLRFQPLLPLLLLFFLKREVL